MTCLERKIKRSNCGFLNWIHIFLDAENSVLCPASYIYLPFRIGENYISLGGGGFNSKSRFSTLLLHSLLLVCYGIFLRNHLE